MLLHIFDNLQLMSEGAANWISDFIVARLKKQDRFCLCLSGGSTPVQLNQHLASSPHKERIDWSRMHIFWGDERGVPFTDDRNNAKMAFDTLLNHVPIPPEQIHIMRTDIPPQEAAAEYEKILHEYFPSNGPTAVTNSFDLLILGLGDDGHTLSLFPGMPVIHEEKAWVDAFYLEAQKMYRITLTRPIANRSARIAFLTVGAGKAHAFKEVLKGKYQPELYPSQLIRPVKGELHWFVDKAAAAGLD